MKVTYDPEVDVLRILFRNTPIEESDEDKPGVILDYDKEGNLVGLEVLNASQRIENPRGVDYTVTAWRACGARWSGWRRRSVRTRRRTPLGWSGR